MKKFLAPFVIGFIIFFNISTSTAADLNPSSQSDMVKLNSGIVTLSYNTETNSKLKVMVEKNGKKVTYNLRNDGITENFPLQMGDGEYKVSILENISGDKYRYLATKDVSLNLTDDKEVYLASVQNINWNVNMNAIKKARELAKGLKSDSQKIDAIYNYLVDNVAYDYDKLAELSSDYLPNIDNTVSSGKGICYDYASAFAAMLRSQGIPTKLVKGYSLNVNGYHAWNEVYDRNADRWIVVDSTYDAQMKAAKVKYSMEKNPTRYSTVFEY